MDQTDKQDRQGQRRKRVGGGRVLRNTEEKLNNALFPDKGRGARLIERLADSFGE
jgi:hypothetical protein